MAALAIPLLAAAADALLVALGITVVVGGTLVVSDEVRKRTKAASDAKAKTDAQPITTTRQACQKCPPDCGQLVPVNHSMNEEPRAYQARITGFAPGTEWRWAGLDFDGFKSALCQLQEAKGNYDQFIYPGGKIKPFFQGFDKMKVQATAQATTVRANPPTSLNWCFQTPMTYALMSRTLSAMGIVTVYAP